MDNFGFNKYVLKPQKSNSVLDEIRAKDIYTVHSPDSCPTLPDIAGSLSASYQLNDPVLLTEDDSAEKLPMLLNSKMESLYVVFEDGLVDRQPKMKKLSIGTYQNLPAVMEEDIELESSQNFNTSDQPSISDTEIKDLPTSSSDTNEMVDFRYSPNEDYYENYLFVDPIEDEESWVDLSGQTMTPPNHPTSPQTFLNGEEYLRLLREAQKESNQSSARVSLSSSRRDSPRDTPRSPPNSPNTEMVLNSEEAPVKEVLINYYNNEGEFIRVEKKVETDWLWHWSSRPDQEPPKDWNFTHSKKVSGRGASLRKIMVGNSNIFSRDVLYTLLLTNVLSLLLGTGIGLWLSKKSGSTVTISQMPLN